MVLTDMPEAVILNGPFAPPGVDYSVIRTYCLGIARKKGLAGDVAEDLFQDVMLNCLGRPSGSIHGPQYVSEAYLHRIVDYRRRAFHANHPLPEDIADDGFLDARCTDPSELVSHADQLAALHRGITRLSPSQRAVCDLYLEGHPTSVIAERLGLDPAAASMRLTRAKQALQARML